MVGIAWLQGEPCLNVGQAHSGIMCQSKPGFKAVISQSMIPAILGDPRTGCMWQEGGGILVSIVVACFSSLSH